MAFTQRIEFANVTRYFDLVQNLVVEMSKEKASTLKIVDINAEVPIEYMKPRVVEEKKKDAGKEEKKADKKSDKKADKGAEKTDKKAEKKADKPKKEVKEEAKPAGTFLALSIVLFLIL